MVAVGLTLAAAGFVGRYAMQAMKHMEPQMKQAMHSFPKSAFGGGYYRGGFDPKMNKREASLVLGVRYCKFQCDRSNCLPLYITHVLRTKVVLDLNGRSGFI
uniref:DnaJ (Hsp40) homolog, subfamily C, member 19 n=1 Tax=Hucho hucho TaxID=62062 RepID=A0A4W5P697_9TELE